MLAAGFLQEYGLLPALMDGERQYLTADDALWHVLNAVEAQPEGLWRQPEVYSVDWNSPMEARQRPCELFVSWLEWLQHSAFAPGTSSGSLPIHRRHIVSVRGRSQEELRREVAACPKQDHWNPSSNPVFMLIEEPLTGENVARSVRENAFQDILAELQRALEIMSANDADTAFEETARGSWSCFSCQRSDIEKGLLMVLDLAKAQKGQGAFRQAAQAAGWATASWGAVKRLVDSLGRHSPQRSVNHFPQQGLLPSGASGAVLVPADASTPYKDLYIALLRGSSLPDSLVTVRARICSPSEGSKAFRLATRRTEGLAASTLLRPLSIGRVDGLPATLVLLRPKHRAPPVPQQLQLHCVAAGCPVLGDRLHDADRRLDFRFEAPDPSPRLMLHCLRVQVEGQEIRAPEDLRANLEIERELVDLEEAETELMLAEDGPELPDTWDTFAGGLPSQILDDTSWDRLRLPRAVRSPPYGPAQWDERTQAFEERQEARVRALVRLRVCLWRRGELDDLGPLQLVAKVINDLEVAFEVAESTEGPWQVLYPKGRVQVTGESFQVRLREDDTIAVTVKTLLFAGKPEMKVTISEMDEDFCTRVAHWLQQERQDTWQETKQSRRRKEEIDEMTRSNAFRRKVCSWEAFVLTFAILCLLCFLALVAAAVWSYSDIIAYIAVAAGPCCLSSFFLCIASREMQDTGRCTCQMLWLVLAYLWGLACLIGTIGWKNLFLVPFAFGPFLCVAARHVCSAAGCCGKRWHREAELFVRETTIMFEGKVIEEPGTACVASWPGIYATAWHYLAMRARGGQTSAAVVFLPKGTQHYGKHYPIPKEEGLQGECWCFALYGEKKEWGCQWWSVWIENVYRAMVCGAVLHVYYCEGFCGRGKAASFATVGQENLVRENVEKKMEDFSVSKEFQDAAQAGLCRLSDEQRYDGSSQFSREMKRLFRKWLPLEDLKTLEDLDGLGPSQRAEVAWLDRKGYPYIEMDVIREAHSTAVLEDHHAAKRRVINDLQVAIEVAEGPGPWRVAYPEGRVQVTGESFQVRLREDDTIAVTVLTSELALGRERKVMVSAVDEEFGQSAWPCVLGCAMGAWLASLFFCLAWALPNTKVCQVGWRREAENRVRDRTIMFEGKISEEPGTACIASWPGLYATAWHYLARQARGGQTSAAVVFLPEGTQYYGNHSPIPEEEGLCGACWCLALYGEEKEWGCQWWSVWIENIHKAMQYGVVLHVYFWEGLRSKGKVASFATVGQENLVRESVRKKMQDFERSKEYADAKQAGLLKLSDRKRYDGSSQHSREVQRLFRKWLPPE
ncbi:Uncharacterized protein SCF082_LOCUS14158, partial [Durusdinium trenchii]